MRLEEPASLIRRLAAMVYDAVLLIGVFFIATLAWVFLQKGQAVSPNTLAFDSYLFTVSYLFFGWFWTHGGQTLGMKAWKIRLTRQDRKPISWKAATIRYFAATLSLLAVGAGFLWALVDRKKRTFHDWLSNTQITRTGQ
jgi:uncharacterized RDD family membrane protein YckC